MAGTVSRTVRVRGGEGHCQHHDHPTRLLHQDCDRLCHHPEQGCQQQDHDHPPIPATQKDCEIQELKLAKHLSGAEAAVAVLQWFWPLFHFQHVRIHQPVIVKVPLLQHELQLGQRPHCCLGLATAFSEQPHR